MILDICYNYLKTKKDVLVEETKGVYKIVMLPRVKFTTAIKMIRKNSRALHYENSGLSIL